MTELLEHQSVLMGYISSVELLEILERRTHMIASELRYRADSNNLKKTDIEKLTSIIDYIKEYRNE